MSLLPSIDTSQFTTPYAAAQEINPYQSTRSIDDAKAETPNVAAEDAESPKVDLNNYYSNIQPSYTEGRPEEYLPQVSQNFNNAIMSALENGYTPQDAVQIQKAKTAYTAMLKIIDYSNFEIKI